MKSLRSTAGILLITLAAALQSPQGMAQSSSLTITAPATGTVVNPGQVVTVSVSADPTAYPNGLSMAVVAEDPLGVAPPQTGSTVNFTLTVPAVVAPGLYNVTAIAKDSAGNQLQSAPISLDVERTDDPLSIAVHPSSVKLYYVGATVTFSVIGTFSDGSVLDVTRSSLTTVSVDNTTVASVQNRMIVAQGPGHTYVRAGYDSGAVTARVTVVVVPSGIQGDLNGDKQVDQADLDILQAALNTPATTPNDARDLNHDGVITAADLTILRSLCTRPSCATH